jgi:signal peptidase II
MAILVVMLDQLTKSLVLTRLCTVERSVAIIPGLFQIRYVHNAGAAWGILRGTNDWLVLLSLILLTFLIIYWKRLVEESVLCRISAGIILGGIIGNLIDRIKYGYVVDFLDFHIRSHHFPAFNIADTAICVGVGLYIFHYAMMEKKNASLSTNKSSAEK